MNVSNIGAWPAATRSYIEELQMEMRRVTWPSRAQVIATTAVVIATVFLFGLYFAVVDQLVGRLITQLFESLAR